MVFDMSEKHAVAMSALFKITGNIERMGDHATNIAGYANLLESKGLKLSEKARAEVSQMVKTTSEAYNILLGSKPGSVHIKMATTESTSSRDLSPEAAQAMHALSTLRCLQTSSVWATTC